MKVSKFIPMVFALMLLTLAVCFSTNAVAAEVNSASAEAKAANKAARKAWMRVPDILRRIVPPQFPHRDFVITKFGAVGDGDTDCTEAFRKAIAACSKRGGGRVVVPPGVFLTGAIHLQNNVNLHVEKGATIRFSTDPRKYLPVVLARYECTEVMNYSPFIYAFEKKNIAITGEGTLDGQGSKGWHQWTTNRTEARQLVELGNRDVPVKDRVFGEGHFLRPNFIQPFRCRNVLIEGVRIVDSPMWVITPTYCMNVTVRGVTVNTKGPNTDGCDPDSSSYVWIKNCSFSDGDDCIAIKSGRDHDGQRVNIPSKNIVIQNCVFAAGHGGVTEGSETSGGIANVFAENCRFDSPDLDMAIRLKTNPARGGYIENVYVRNCVVKTAKVGIHMTLRYSSSGAAEGKNAPIIRNIDVRNIKFEKLLKEPIFIQGYSESAKITDVTIANCIFEKTTTTNSITNAERIHLINNHGLPSH